MFPYLISIPILSEKRKKAKAVAAVSFRMVVSQLHSTRDRQAVSTFLRYSILRNLFYLTIRPAHTASLF